MATDLTPFKPIQPLPGFAGILRDQETFGTGDERDLNDRLNTSFDRLLLQSGVQIAPSMFLLLSICAGIALGGLVFVIQENFLTTGLAFAFGGMLPVTAAVIARSRRQFKIMNQMPAMIDELSRAAKTGRSIEQCFTFVAQDTPSPLGDELRLCASKLDLGVGLRGALDELYERTGVVSLNILVMALSVHQVSGGDLVGVLERLSRTIRERILYLGRLRAATAASRATAILMIALPPGILAFFIFRDPDYLTKLTNSTWGRNITTLAILMDIVGVCWVLRILKNSQRT